MVTSSRDSYVVWHAKGGMSVRSCDIWCAVGLVVLGWLIVYVYSRAGKTVWVMAPIFVLYMLGIWLHYAFSIASIVVYLLAWYYIHKTIRGYEERLRQESQGNP